jgi:hypothetical protein
MVILRGSKIGRLAEVHFMLVASGPRPHTQGDQPILTFSHHEVVLEDLKSFKKHFLTVRDDFLPVLQGGS